MGDCWEHADRDSQGFTLGHEPGTHRWYLTVFKNGQTMKIEIHGRDRMRYHALTWHKMAEEQ